MRAPIRRPVLQCRYPPGAGDGVDGGGLDGPHCAGNRTTQRSRPRCRHVLGVPASDDDRRVVRVVTSAWRRWRDWPIDFGQRRHCRSPAPSFRMRRPPSPVGRARGMAHRAASAGSVDESVSTGLAACKLAEPMARGGVNPPIPPHETSIRRHLYAGCWAIAAERPPSTALIRAMRDRRLPADRISPWGSRSRGAGHSHSIS